jgi:uncharacterized membrane protein
MHTGKRSVRVLQRGYSGDLLVVHASRITLLLVHIPIPDMKLVRYAIAAVLIITFFLTLAVYPGLPDSIASHWNAAGQVDGYMVKAWGLPLIPLIMAGFVALFALLPRIDPHRMNYEKFRSYYEGFILLFVLYLFAIHLQIILWSLGYQVSPNLTFPFLFGILFIYIGFLLEHAEQNWFVGIRTPWTLSSTTVWKKTHQAGGTLFKIAGVISCASVLAGAYAPWFILVPVLAVAVFTVVYSFWEFRKESRVQGKEG